MLATYLLIIHMFGYRENGTYDQLGPFEDKLACHVVLNRIQLNNLSAREMLGQRTQPLYIPEFGPVKADRYYYGWATCVEDRN